MAKPQAFVIEFVWNGVLLVRSDGLTLGSVWRAHRNTKWSGEALRSASSELAVRKLSTTFDTEAEARAAVEAEVMKTLGGKPHE